MYLRPTYIWSAIAVLFALLGCRPTDELAPDSRIAQAVEEVQNFGFQRAGELFASVVADSEPGSLTWQQAIYGQAVCQQHSTPIRPDRLVRAQELYRSLIDQAPESTYTARAILNLGRIAELSDHYGDPPQPEQARVYYQQVIDRWPTDPLAGEATLRLAATYVQTFEPDQVRQGIGILESWLAAHPEEPLRSVMWQYLGNACFAPLADYALAMKWYRKSDQAGMLDHSRRAATYWRMARMSETRLGDRGAAVEYYTKLIQAAPTGSKAYPAEAALRRLGAPVPEIEILKDVASAEPAVAIDGSLKDPNEERSR